MNSRKAYGTLNNQSKFEKDCDTVKPVPRDALSYAEHLKTSYPKSNLPGTVLIVEVDSFLSCEKLSKKQKVVNFYYCLKQGEGAP